MYKQILKILKMNKYEDDYAGVYPYEKEEYAKMITNYVKSRDRNKKVKT